MGLDKLLDEVGGIVQVIVSSDDVLVGEGLQGMDDFGVRPDVPAIADVEPVGAQETERTGQVAVVEMVFTEPEHHAGGPDRLAEQ